MRVIVLTVTDEGAAGNIGSPGDFKAVFPIDDSMVEDKPMMAAYIEKRVGPLAATAYRELP